MSTSVKSQTCGCVTINPAFLQEVKEAYSSVWENMHQLLDAAARGLPLSVDMNHWVAQLSSLRGQLSSEFSLEETYGYVTNATQVISCHNLDPAVTRSQHAELYLQLSELCEQVEEAQYRGTLMRDFPSYAESFFAFIDRLQAHERSEAKLIEYGLGLPTKDS